MPNQFLNIHAQQENCVIIARLLLFLEKLTFPDIRS